MKPLRALVITESDPIYVIEFFEEFLRELPRDGIDVAAIAICRAFHEPLHRTAVLVRSHNPNRQSLWV